MTIVVATTAPDGIVLASDSRTTLLRGPLRYRIGTDHAHKLFVPSPRVGVATFGTAVLGEKTIAGLMEQFGAEKIRPGQAPDPEQMASLLQEFFQAKLDDESAEVGHAPPSGILGFLVAGYDVRGVGHVLEVLLPESETRESILDHAVDTQVQGVITRGRTRYIRRMLDAWDRDGFKLLRDKLSALSDDEVVKVQQGYEAKFGMKMNPPISLQDALDFAAFIVRTTIDMERFTDGFRDGKGDVPICGGRVQGLVITRDNAEWVARNSLTSAAFGAAPTR